MGGAKEQKTMQEEYRVLATQIEAINQQLAGGGGAGGGPGMTTAFGNVEEKLNYLYEFVKNMEVQLLESEQEYFKQIGVKVQAALNKNLTELFAKVDEVSRGFAEIHEGLKNSPAIAASDIVEIKQTLMDLIGVYKDEVEVFKEQNAYLQKKLEAIEKRLDSKK